MQTLQEIDVSCPYCSAPFTLLLDLSQGPSDYIEDCAVCCAPIEVMLRFDAQEIRSCGCAAATIPPRPGVIGRR